jgi:hypothetical protein
LSASVFGIDRKPASASKIEALPFYSTLKSNGVEDDHRNGESDQAEKLSSREADEQAALLAISGSRIAQRALKERTEDVTDASSSGTNANSRETGTNHFCSSKIHCFNS